MFFMKNTIKVLGIIALVAIIGFSMVACNQDAGNPFIGTWSDGWYTLTCTASTWNVVSESTYWLSGSYTYNGNSANFIETNGLTFGTATVSGNTMTVASTYGSFNLTRN